MLKIGSTLNISDNSGGRTIKILNIKKKKNNSYATVSDLFLGVVQSSSPIKKRKKLKKKTKIVSVVVCTKKKVSKKNGMFITFSENRCIPLKISRFIMPFDEKIFTPVVYNLSYNKKFKILIKNTKLF